ncbi:dynein heavy chain 12, axonemal-like isoform X2 [Cimex lectularius]|uniref:Dynein heavy chain n=1 Tax=Cimex lectularius TaxID=79782 RepID=A0A8I6THN8_CIMLE|nr:dynein heavy chain 12, axonemal-like isoform X2 [Cimex lectularius]
MTKTSKKKYKKAYYKEVCLPNSNNHPGIECDKERNVHPFENNKNIGRQKWITRRKGCRKNSPNKLFPSIGVTKIILTPKDDSIIRSNKHESVQFINKSYTVTPSITHPATPDPKVELAVQTEQLAGTQGTQKIDAVNNMKSIEQVVTKLSSKLHPSKDGKEKDEKMPEKLTSRALTCYNVSNICRTENISLQKSVVPKLIPVRQGLIPLDLFAPHDPSEYYDQDIEHLHLKVYSDVSLPLTPGSRSSDSISSTLCEHRRRRDSNEIPHELFSNIMKQFPDDRQKIEFFYPEPIKLLEFETNVNIDIFRVKVFEQQLFKINKDELHKNQVHHHLCEKALMIAPSSTVNKFLHNAFIGKKEVFFVTALDRLSRNRRPALYHAPWFDRGLKSLNAEIAIRFQDFLEEMQTDIDALFKRSTQKVSTYGSIQHERTETYFPFKPLKQDGDGKKFNHETIEPLHDVEENVMFYHPVFLYIRATLFDELPVLYFDVGIFRTKRFYTIKHIGKKMLSEIRLFNYYDLGSWYQRVISWLKSDSHIHPIPYEKLGVFSELLNQFIKGQILEYVTKNIKDAVEKFIDPCRTPMIHMFASYNNRRIVMTPSFKKLYRYYAACIRQFAMIGKGFIHPQYYLIEGTEKISMRNTFLDATIRNYQKLVVKNMRNIIEPTLSFYRKLAMAISDITPHRFYRGVYTFGDMDLLFEMIYENLEKRKKIRHLSDFEYIGITRVNQTYLKASLEAVIATQLHDITTELILMHIEENFKLQKMFNDIKERCVRIPKTTEELMALGKYMCYCRTILMERLRLKCVLSMVNVARLSDLLILTPNHIELISKTVTIYNTMPRHFKKFTHLFETSRFAMESRLHRMTEELNHALEQYGSEYLEGLNNFDTLDKIFYYSQYLTKNVRLMEAFDERVAFINKEESLFQIPPSTYPELDELKSIIFPFTRLVLMLNKWMRYRKKWLRGPFDKLVLEEVENTIEEFLKTITLFHKQYKSTCKMQILDNYPKRFKGQVDDPDFTVWPSPLKLTYLGLESIKEMKHHLTLIGIMCNPCLGEMHWQEMSNITGFDMMPHAGTCLQNFIDYNLEGQLNLFEIISVGAVREVALRENFEKMKAEWENMRFNILKYKNTNINILGSVDEIQALLDDHIIRTLSMRGSAFVRPVEADVRAWYELLKLVNLTIDQWSKVQVQWLYLLPIFSSKYIVAQMPEEGLLFHNIDRAYNAVIREVNSEPHVLTIAGTGELNQVFETCLDKLETINAGVIKYLELKRIFFPRFFFLSNDEMLEILSETSNPTRVQPHLRKCFEGIHSLSFNAELFILSMFSQQKEEVALVTPISTVAAKGSVELWLVQLEQEMVASVRAHICQSYADYSIVKRNSWIQRWPGQVVLCVSQIYWTSECHACLLRCRPKIMKRYHNYLQQQLNRTIKLVRGHLSGRNRITMCSLVVIDVHAKDVVWDLVEKNVKGIMDFLWLAQLRYYWLKGVVVQLTNASVKYAYEYLGNTERLVITPLTDRCYRTLVGAYNLNLNGAPEGPAGAGKTETTKDLAKAVAVQCVVFNCSDGLDYIAMGKFFKGLASSGAWACFDEFNRIDIEVLSVIAQQILCIMQAIRNKLEVFKFEGTTLKLNQNCYICITMNPGYAGRSELPDNLKVLFRPVAMMVPDYSLIGEISLYSFGFMHARELSGKIVTTYKLCSEQLSSQSHYDYGMRAVKTVLSAAGRLKLKFPDENEHLLILRSIIDVNLPKFLNCDVPLFNGIISDLFPGLKLPDPNYREFYACIEKSCMKENLQPHPIFIKKVTQSYEMMLVRHGFMLVGDPFSGKTKSLKILAMALARMGQRLPIRYITLNPKAVTIGQLYGSFDSISYEWSDGVIATAFRVYATDPRPYRKWIVFDGPVDAVWIENMNTVLDDNKKLCLNSGEVIQMTPVMSMIFEVMDLTQASPATVSRCGMIYFEPKSMGWKPLAKSWSDALDDQWTKDKPERFMEIFDWVINPSLKYIRKLKRVIDGGIINQVWSCLKVIHMHLIDAQQAAGDLSKTFISCLQAACILGLIWGLGGSLDQKSMELYDLFVKDMWGGKNEQNLMPSNLDPLEIDIPTEGLLIDYYYNFKGKGGWKYYPENLKAIKLDDKSNLQTMLVPTIESMRYMSLLELHCRHHAPFLVTGATGTGKSFVLQHLLMTRLPLAEYTPSFITFTTSTTANMTQILVLSELVKKRRGVYGAVPGKTAVLFIDDIGMPAREKYGAQPPIELLRQYFDHGYWFDLKSTYKLVIQNLFIVAAMGLPGGGRQNVYKRFLRHFSLYSINEFTDESLARIFQTILTIGLRRNGFPTDIMLISQQIVASTLLLYKESCIHLLPTPAKSHYVFNLRDFSRVINGHLLLRKESVDSKKVFVRLWAHEVLRVFYDRLIDRSDRIWFIECIKRRIEHEFREKMSMMLDGLNEDPHDKSVTEETLRNLMFTVVLDKDSDDEKRYEEIPSLDAFFTACSNALINYNETTRKPMEIVLFRYALEHLSRICRILTLSGGCALLVGVGGSGRQSLVKLAAYICEQNLFQPEISNAYGLTEWRDDIKRILKDAGGKGKSVVFLLGEGQIKFEYFLQDVDALLNSGEVPNLFAVDEKQEILDMTRLAAQGGNRNMDINPLAVFHFFTNRCKQNMHIMLCCSPIGSTFRTRLRLYPSLVNCCTIDWYEGWPEDALEKVAKQFLANCTFDEAVKDAAVQVCKYFHISSRVLAEKFFTALGKTVYITSTSYLDLIKAYTKLVTKKQDELREAKMRYLGGLEKLEFAAEQVTVMQHDLELLQPQLKESVDETQEMLNGVEKERHIVDAASAQVREDEKAANEQADAAVTLKIECENDLALAIPILEDATAALNTLKPADITLVKSMKNPPDTVKLVMAAVCVMKDIKPRRIPDPKNPGRKVFDYWGPSKRILGDMGFLQSLKDYDKDDIPPHIIQVIRKRFVEHPDFRPNVVAKASSAAEGLCKWVLAMEKYDVVVKMVAPKKKKLAQAERDFAKTKKLLDSKRNELNELENRLADLNHKLETALAEKTRLQNEVLLCSNKLKKAKKIIGNLGGEKVRWLEEAENLQGLHDRLPGDVLLSCGVIAYLAPFTKSFRNSQIEDWKNVCIESLIPTSKDYSLVKNLGSDVRIHSWIMNRLPADSFSIDNAIIMNASSKWPLFIDPQGQANRWVKSMEKDHELEIIKLSDPNYMRTVETCIEYGKPLLLENVLEDMDAPLDPVLLKSTYVQGNEVFILLGEKLIEYQSNFKMYITTKLRNPHYLPEIFNKVTLINFSLTFEGLSDQLLGIVVAKERPDLQEKREQLIVQGAANRQALQETEDDILKVLSSVQGNILEDEEAVDTLDKAKALAVDLTNKQLAARETEIIIEEFRLQYKPIADYSANLYYTITELPNVDPMYQYSLSWFINIYTVSIEFSGKSKMMDFRLRYLKEGFLRALYASVCRSLFDKDKPLYSFLVCTAIMLFYKEISKKELDFFLTGGLALENKLPNTESSWLDTKSWDELCRLKDLPGFEDILNHFSSFAVEWQKFYELPEPGFDDLPLGYRSSLNNNFKKLLVFRVFRPDRIFALIYEFVKKRIGPRYMQPPPFDLGRSFRDSLFNTPLIFILSSGVDPMQALMAFAHKMDFTNKFKSMSLGQGQGPKAEELIKSAQLEGHWICLQNCHLCLSWLPTLEKICEDFHPTNCNPNFRLWLTSYPTSKFPESILQNGVKITNEAPTGLQQNLERLYNSEPVCQPKFYESCRGKDLIFARMLFGLSFFHAVILERKKFGSIGWNTPYGFNESDYLISIEQLKMYLKEFAEIPYDAILYLAGECNYGGRVTDNWDRRTLSTLLSKFINSDLIFSPNYNLAPPDERYAIPLKYGYTDFLRFIKNIPPIQSPEIYGLHANAGIKRSLNEFKQLTDSMSFISGRSAKNSKGEAQLVGIIVDDILEKLPGYFDVAAAEKNYPVDYKESMNTVLVQEMKRFNILTEVIKTSLQQLKLGIQGRIVMTPELEAISNALLKSKVPGSWSQYSYPSLRPLGPYIQDLLERLAFINKWFLNGKPTEYWISGLFFTQGFLTGAMQNYARKSKISIDELVFDFHIGGEKKVIDCGILVYGLFIDGARWDKKRNFLVEQLPKVLFDSLPLMWIKPCHKSKLVVGGRYLCPLYKTSERRGELSTTGHSTNYVLPILLDTNPNDTTDHWILRGAALLCQLDS